MNASFFFGDGSASMLRMRAFIADLRRHGIAARFFVDDDHARRVIRVRRSKAHAVACGAFGYVDDPLRGGLE